MIGRSLSKELKGQAIGLGLCKEWTDGWGKPDKQGLIDKYKRGIDFAIAHDWPRVEYIKRHFESDLLHRNLIFVDEDVDIGNGATGIYVLNGRCKGRMRFGGYAVATLYVRHDCEMDISVEGLAKVFVKVHDGAKVCVRQGDAAKVYVYRKSVDCEVVTEGDVLVR